MSSLETSAEYLARAPRASLLHSLVDQSPALIAVCARNGTYLYVNDAFARTLGVATEFLLGRKENDVLGSIRTPPGLHVCAMADESAVTHRQEGTGVASRARRYLTTRFPIKSATGEFIATGMIATELCAATATSGTSDPAGDVEARHTELLRALEQMERLAYTDRLTGAWNRRHLEDATLLEMARAERHGHPVALLVLDIDHFKNINDNFGHAVGDHVLVELVRCIRNNIRRADTITRWGGEEFVVLAPDTPLREAEQLAQKLCDCVAATRLTSSGNVTISVGVAEYLYAEGLSQWLLRADRAMYRAKADGRNRVAVDPQTGNANGTQRTAGSPVQLIWRDSYCSGDAAIDHQHRQLFEHANRLLQSVINHAPREQILATARLLVEDIAEHFADEERLQGEIGFPGRQAHADEHARLFEKATKLFAQTSDNDALPVGEVLHFLAYEVVAQHLLGADRHYFPYLEKACAADAP